MLNQPKLPKHVRVGSPAEKTGGSLLHLASGVIRAFLGDRRFPGPRKRVKEPPVPVELPKSHLNFNTRTPEHDTTFRLPPPYAHSLLPLHLRHPRAAVDGFARWGGNRHVCSVATSTTTHNPPGLRRTTHQAYGAEPTRPTSGGHRKARRGQHAAAQNGSPPINLPFLAIRDHQVQGQIDGFVRESGTVAQLNPPAANDE